MIMSTSKADKSEAALAVQLIFSVLPYQLYIKKRFYILPMAIIALTYREREREIKYDRLVVSFF